MQNVPVIGLILATAAFIVNADESYETDNLDHKTYCEQWANNDSIDKDDLALFLAECISSLEAEDEELTHELDNELIETDIENVSYLDETSK